MENWFTALGLKQAKSTQLFYRAVATVICFVLCTAYEPAAADG